MAVSPRLLIIVAAAALSAGSLTSRADAISDDIIRDRILQAAAGEDRLAGSKVTVSVRNGDVVLGGTVRLYRQKMLYEEIAWHTYGVADLDNEIRTEPVMPLSDAEIRKAIIALSKEHPRFQGSGISADVDEGAVRVRGLFHDASDVLFFKRQLAEIEGVVRIEIIATFHA
jgi:hypothetical protein